MPWMRYSCTGPCFLHDAFFKMNTPISPAGDDVPVTQFCYISRDAAVDTVSNKIYAFLGRRLRIKDHTATSLTVRELAGMLGRSTYAGEGD